MEMYHSNSYYSNSNRRSDTFPYDDQNLDRKLTMDELDTESQTNEPSEWDPYAFNYSVGIPIEPGCSPIVVATGDGAGGGYYLSKGNITISKSVTVPVGEDKYMNAGNFEEGV